MTDEAMSPLRRRMIEDMTIRKFAPKTQHDYVQRIKNFTAFLGRSPGTASFEDVRRYQLHLAARGVGVPTLNQTVATLRSFSGSPSGATRSWNIRRLSTSHAETLRARGRRSLSDFRRAGGARVGAGRRDRQAAAHRHRARRELLPLRHPHPGHRGYRRGLRRAELGARGELQHHPRGAQGQDGPLRREADPDHAAGSLAKSLRVANELLAKHDLADSIHLTEGSGISRDNRFTARGLAQVLHLFKPHATLLRGGEGALFKTGTFSGVRTLAGYADTSGHGRVRFVIALKSNDGAMRFRLLKAIQSGL